MGYGAVEKVFFLMQCPRAVLPTEVEVFLKKIYTCFFIVLITNNSDFFGEAVLDLKKFSEVSPRFPNREYCLDHASNAMIQIFSLRLAKSPIISGLMLLYGYLAARDCMDGKLNYIFNRSRDNPVIIQQVRICYLYASIMIMLNSRDEMKHKYFNHKAF